MPATFNELIDACMNKDNLTSRLINDDVRANVRAAIHHDIAALNDERVPFMFDWDSDGDEGEPPLFAGENGGTMIDLIYNVVMPDEHVCRIIGDETNGDYIVIGETANDDEGQIASFVNMPLAAMFVARCIIPET